MPGTELKAKVIIANRSDIDPPPLMLVESGVGSHSLDK